MWQVDFRAIYILVWTARGAEYVGELGRTEPDSTGKSAYTWNHPARLADRRARLEYARLFISNPCNVRARAESRRALPYVVSLEGTRSICLRTSLRVVPRQLYLNWLTIYAWPLTRRKWRYYYYSTLARPLIQYYHRSNCKSSVNWGSPDRLSCESNRTRLIPNGYYRWKW